MNSAFTFRRVLFRISPIICAIRLVFD